MDVLCGRVQSTRTVSVVGLCALLVILLTVRGAESGGAAAGYLTPGFRPPSVPLIVVDPYLRYVATNIIDNIYLRNIILSMPTCSKCNLTS